MANQEHLDILAKGVEVWNAWRRDSVEERFRQQDPRASGYIEDEATFYAATALAAPDLSGANLRRARLGNADFFSVALDSADLRGADLSYAKLNSASLRHADLTRTNLMGADLSLTVLQAANLTGAFLNGAVLYRTDLSTSRLDHATMGCIGPITTHLSEIDLRTTLGLETVRHWGPSSIAIEVIYRNGGNIPESFLRGCGVPDNFIAYMHSLTGAAFDFYSCFISYSSKDQEFADQLHCNLQGKGVRCWFAPHDIQGGQKVHEQIDEAIRIYDKLLLILSDASMNSNWVKTEIANARAREARQKRQMLFPITLVSFDRIKEWKLFDADTGIDSAREIREYFIPDFSNWKDHDSYQQAFERLLRDLKAEARDKATA